MTATASAPTTTASSRPRPATAAFLGAAATLALAAGAIGLSLGDATDERWRLAARYTARVAFLLFLPVYVASSWNRLWPSDASRFAMRRRRTLGLSFATAHGIHLIALTTYSILAADVPDVATIVGGGGAFVAMFAMVATSNDAAVRQLGRNWLRLHKVGVHWLWYVFAFSYAGRVAAGQLFFVPFLGLALGALGLRIAVWRRRRARRSRPA